MTIVNEIERLDFYDLEYIANKESDFKSIDGWIIYYIVNKLKIIHY